MPRIAVALILSLVYAGIIVSVAGVQPKNGFPWWFFAPGMVAMAASFLAQTAKLALPRPWATGNTGGEPPRTVQLSWNAALGLPVYVPVLFFPWYFLAITRMHFDTRVADFLIVVLVVLIVLHGVLKSARESALVREGGVTEAVVEKLDRDRYGSYKIWYRFDAPNGESINGRAYHPGPVPELGHVMPVYFDVSEPRRHVLAGASWFEAS
jgi:hypothetical protein